MATIGFRTLALVFGAGYSGTYLYNNMDRARQLAAQIILNHQNSENQSGQQTGALNTSNSDIEALSRQMNQIAAEVSKQSRTEPVVIMGSGAGYRGSISTVSDMLNLMGWAVVAVSASSVVYYVAYRKNVSLRDLAWVSQSTFNGTIEAMQHGITRVKGMVSAVKRDLSQRLQLLEGRVDNVRTALSEQIDREVTDVKNGVNNVGEDVAEVRSFLGGVDNRISQLSGKMDAANFGVFALARVVSTMAPEPLPPRSPFHDLRKFLEAYDTQATDPAKPEQPLIRNRASTGLSALIENVGASSGEEKKINNREQQISSSKLKMNQSSSSDIIDAFWRG